MAGSRCRGTSPSWKGAGVSSANLAYAIVEVTTNGGSVWAYGSVIDSDSGDPYTVPVVNLAAK